MYVMRGSNVREDDRKKKNISSAQFGLLEPSFVFRSTSFHVRNYGPASKRLLEVAACSKNNN